MSKKNTSLVNGALWNLLERLGTQTILVIFTIILARLVAPSDYGTISLVTIFIALINVLVDGGFSAAIIQKDNLDNRDYSTVFYFNLIFSFLIMLAVMFIAPAIADFYGVPLLIPIMRVLAFKIPLVAISAVQQAIVMRELQFSKFFITSTGATFISGVVSIILAYFGFGVWALVAQDFLVTTCSIIIMFALTRWKPMLYFSIARLKNLYDYGWKLLVQSLLNTLFANVRSLLIAKFYSPEDLAYYTKGNQYPNLIVTNVDTAISRALFPVMSRAQSSIMMVRSYAQKAMQVSSFILSPLLVGLIVMAKPFTVVLLTEKWLDMIPYLQIICVTLLFRAPQTALLQSIKSVGRSDIILKMDVPLRILGLILLFSVINWGVIYIALSEVVLEITVFSAYMYFAKEHIGIRYREVFASFLNNVGIAIIMGVAVYLVGAMGSETLLTYAIQILIGACIYLGLAYLTRNPSIVLLGSLIQSKRKG